MTENHEAPATPDVRLLESFVNTNDIEEERDELRTPADLKAWLAERGYEAGSVDAETHARAIAVREGIRALARANNGEPLDLDRVDALNRAAAAMPVTIGLTPEGWDLVPAGSGAEAFLAHLLATVARSKAEGSWSRVKACRNDTCRWLFFDESRNRSHTWCSMAVCGSRAKSRAYRARRRDSATA
ncbi:MAG TPA: CGNR zinc finger domain-containing protein [Candidatus Limnocylindria bacterium]